MKRIALLTIRVNAGGYDRSIKGNERLLTITQERIIKASKRHFDRGNNNNTCRS